MVLTITLLASAVSLLGVACLCYRRAWLDAAADAAEYRGLYDAERVEAQRWRGLARKMTAALGAAQAAPEPRRPGAA